MGLMFSVTTVFDLVKIPKRMSTPYTKKKYNSLLGEKHLELALSETAYTLWMPLSPTYWESVDSCRF